MAWSIGQRPGGTPGAPAGGTPALHGLGL